MILPENVTPKKRAFLQAYVLCGQIVASARAATINEHTHYEWLENDPEYPALFAAAKAEFTHLLESEAIRRAYTGVDEPVVHKGQFQYPDLKEDGTPDLSRPLCVRKFSDVLMIFLLKGALPDKYKERNEHTGPGGGPITTKLEIAYLDKPKPDGAD